MARKNKSDKATARNLRVPAVKNIGTAPTPEGVVSGVAFTVDGKIVAWSDTVKSALAPGASVTCTANGGPGWTAAP
jgi:hypothetical protein